MAGKFKVGDRVQRGGPGRYVVVAGPNSFEMYVVESGGGGWWIASEDSLILDRPPIPDRWGFLLGYLSVNGDDVSSAYLDELGARAAAVGRPLIRWTGEYVDETN